MASQTMSAAEIAELLDEAAAARELAAVSDSAAAGDLLKYALALEACAAGELAGAPLHDRQSDRSRRQAG